MGNWKIWRDCRARPSNIPKRDRRITKTQKVQIENMLEVGFGHGSLMAYCREQGWRISGTEASGSLVRAAKQRGFNGVLAENLDQFENASFDLIACFYVVEHVPQSAILSFLDSLRQKLKPDGIIFLRFPNADSWLGSQNFNDDLTHVTAIGHFKLEYFCQRAGLEIVDFRPEARLGFDGGIAKSVRALIMGPMIKLIGVVVKAMYFPRSRVALTSANVVAYSKIRNNNFTNL